MSLRKRLSLVAAASVAVAVLIAVVVCYMVVRSQLLGQVDGSLRAQATLAQRGLLEPAIPANSASSGGPAPYNQVVLADGSVDLHNGDVALPITRHVLRIASSGRGSSFGDFEIDGNHLRLLTVPVLAQGFGGGSVLAALELARPLNGVDSILAHLRLILLALFAGGIALAAALGRLGARRVLAPLEEVAQAAQHIAETDDLSRRIRVHADDEVGQLALRFNTMLDRLEGSRAALDDSMRAQRQLVADASHELRTPVTSLRTNIEVLLAGAELHPEDRRRLLTDVVEQSEELSALVNDLIELARGDQPGAETEEVRLDGIAAESLARARRNAPQIRFQATLEPTLIDGVPERLERAINNLLDNAARHSPSGGTVELHITPDGVTVRDHGPGVDPEDQPYVFDRFFRGRTSRGRQGSGLGLAIVRQVTEQHGGTVGVTNAPTGGAVFTLRLPGVAAPAGTETESQRVPEPEPEPAPVRSH
ncbi:MAG: HAMP domain-containing sensor histidine kinase [Solirubrobacteraceae bacterium]